MSVIPIKYHDWCDDLIRPYQFLDEDDDIYRLSHKFDQLLTPFFGHLGFPFRNYRNPFDYRPWLDLIRKADLACSSTIKSDEDKFEVILDVQHFTPDEIKVKVADKYITVEAKHEEKKDQHGWISRQFLRKYLIPEQCEVDQVTSNLSSDGVLTITAPRKDAPKIKEGKPIKIEHTGKPALKFKETFKENEKK